MTPPNTIRRPHLRAAGVLAWLLVLSPPVAHGETIIDTWASVRMPPPPRLAPAEADSAHTALLILDMQAASCSTQQRPRCVATLPQVQHLLEEARAHHMLVVYSAGPPTSKTSPTVVDVLAPLPGEPMVHAPADKFYGGDLDKILSAHDIKSVIVTGTSAEGAVLHTASSASLRGMTAIVPVDGMSSIMAVGELETAWHLKAAPATITSHIVLTRTDMITLH